MQFFTLLRSILFSNFDLSTLKKSKTALVSGQENSEDWPRSAAWCSWYSTHSGINYTEGLDARQPQAKGG